MDRNFYKYYIKPLHFYIQTDEMPYALHLGCRKYIKTLNNIIQFNYEKMSNLKKNKIIDECVLLGDYIKEYSSQKNDGKIFIQSQIECALWRIDYILQN
jgi:hypothetical protein